MENPHFLSSTSPSLLLTITFDCISEFKQRQMETLTIRTDFPSVPSADFSILPSPSTFFLSNNFPSPTFDQYPISATDYHQHFLPPAPEVANPEERAIQELPLATSQASSSDGHSLANDTPSPASSFPSTPTGSPIPQNLVIDHSGEKQHGLSFKVRQTPLFSLPLLQQIG